MKRVDLIKILNQNNWYLLRNGGEHDIYTNGIEKIAIPRHNEINERLAKSIMKKVGA